jgi:hypothetical protein
VLASYSEGVEAELRSMLARGPALFDDLARSICPSVYGCDSVKKAILLMLMGGVHKVTPEVSPRQRFWWSALVAVWNSGCWAVRMLLGLFAKDPALRKSTSHCPEPA